MERTFSPTLVQSAAKEAKACLPPGRAGKLSFHVGRNEKLVEIWPRRVPRPAGELTGYFDLILESTFRYCHRLGKEQDCTADIYHLLRPGGVCINIDMNDRFPAFRSRFKGPVQDPVETYTPSLGSTPRPSRLLDSRLFGRRTSAGFPTQPGPLSPSAAEWRAPCLTSWLATTPCARSW